MKRRGNNLYFNNFDEVETFLLSNDFKYDIPFISDEDLVSGRRVYLVELTEHNKIKYCAVEYIGGGGVYRTITFYDCNRVFDFQLRKIKF